MSTGLNIFRELQDVQAHELRAGGNFLSEFVRYADGSVECWRRECRPDHFTASGVVVNSAGSRVLLGLHAKVGRWLQFGGHIEGEDESLVAAACREVQEESGIPDLVLVERHPVALDAHAAPCAPDAERHLDVQFVFRANDRSVPAVSEESLQLSWFHVEHPPPGTDASVRRLVRVAREVVRHASRPCD